MDQIVGAGQKAGHMRAPNAMYTSNIAADVVTRIAGNDISTAAAGQQPEATDVSLSVIDTKSTS
jgi:hypothetical protein